MKPHNWRCKVGGVNQHYFWNDTWRFGVLVVWPVNGAQLRMIARKHGVSAKKATEEICEIKVASYFNFGDGIHIIAFGKRKTEYGAEVINTIAHEATHCTIAVLMERGITIEESNTTEEPYAYTIGWLVEKIVDARRLLK